jgi:hypothetical protein
MGYYYTKCFGKLKVGCGLIATQRNENSIVENIRK